MFLLYLITTAISIAFIWMLDYDTPNSFNLFLSILCLIPIIPILSISFLIFVFWVVGEKFEFKPIKNPFSKQYKRRGYPKCSFSKFAKYHNGKNNTHKSWLDALRCKAGGTSPFDSDIRSLKILLHDKIDSPYYSASLLGALEDTLILWLDSVIDTDSKTDVSLKFWLNPEHYQFLRELRQSAKIAYDWIVEQEENDKKKEVRDSMETNEKFLAIVKSMKSDLEKIYNTK